MIVSVNQFARAFGSTQVKGSMGGRRQASPEWAYDRTILQLLIGLCAVVAVVGVGALVLAVVRDDYTLLGIGIAVFGVASYLMLAMTKEKANLDLLTTHFSKLSASARGEVIKSLVEHNAASSGGLLGLVSSIASGGKNE